MAVPKLMRLLNCAARHYRESNLKQVPAGYRLTVCAIFGFRATEKSQNSESVEILCRLARPRRLVAFSGWLQRCAEPETFGSHGLFFRD